MNKIYQYIFFVFLIILSSKGIAQQNHLLFQQHHITQSNLLNPAVPISCKWHVGIPIISSVHLNYGNSSFSYRNLVPKNGLITQESIDKAINKLHAANYLGTELHLNLFSLGYKPGNYSFLFSITEKNNISIFYSEEFLDLAWNGNRQFIGKTASMNGFGGNFNHYREYALSISKEERNGLKFGARAKILFGKLNVQTKTFDVSLFTDENTFNLDIEADVRINSSLPVIIPNDAVTSIAQNNNVSVSSLILNRKNPGFAFDVGLIYPLDDKTILSASIIDLGLIRWRSNLNNITAGNSVEFEGVLGQAGINENIQSAAIDSISNMLQTEILHESYTTWLPPRVMVGLNYTVNNVFDASVQGQAIFYRSKIIPSATIVGSANPVSNINFNLSYTVQYYDFRNFGFGMSFGRNPAQFYILTDNLAGLIWPMSTRNLNLRFGLNLNFGCKQSSSLGNKGGSLPGNCYWYEKDMQKQRKKMKKR